MQRCHICYGFRGTLQTLTFVNPIPKAGQVLRDIVVLCRDASAFRSSACERVGMGFVSIGKGGLGGGGLESLA